MENPDKDTKSAPDQIPVDPPSYSEPPNPTTIYVAADPELATIAVQPDGTSVIISGIGIEPVAMVCGVCNQRIVTRIDRLNWFQTHCWASVLCLFGCWPCVPIPYCTHVCKKAVHYCPNCDAYIGTQL